MRMLQEFREFAVKGNAIDLAIGVIIGGAFGAIVTSLVGDVVMPPFGLLMGGMDFSNLFVDLSGGTHASLAAAREAGAPVIAYGKFLNTVINLLIVAGVLFAVVRTLNRLKREPLPAPAEPTTKACPHCAMEIPVAAKRCGHCTSSL